MIGAAGEALVRKAAAAAKFKGKPSTALDILAPAGLSANRLLVVGTSAPSGYGMASGHRQAGNARTAAAPAAIKPDVAPDAPPITPILAVSVIGKLGRDQSATIVFDPPRSPDDAAGGSADFALGVQLRDYRFDRYKTKKKDDADENGQSETFARRRRSRRARSEAKRRDAVVDGVIIARELVNEPPNVLYPVEFARRASSCEKLGVEVEVLDVKAMKKLGMGALLGVAQGSARQSRTVIMRWNGGKREADAAGRLHRQGRLLSIPAAFRSSPPPAWRT